MPSTQQRRGRRAINLRTATAFIVFLAVIAAVAVAIGIYLHGLIGH